MVGARRAGGGAPPGPATDGGQGAWPGRRGGVARRGGPGAQTGSWSDSPLCLEPGEPLVPLGGRGREPRRGRTSGPRLPPAAGGGHGKEAERRGAAPRRRARRGAGGGGGGGRWQRGGAEPFPGPPAASGRPEGGGRAGGLLGAVESRGG